MKKILTTFSGCSYPLKLSQLNLIEQAKKYCDGCATFDEFTPSVQQLFNTYKDIFQYRKGVGYWLWKPFVILETLKAANDGDIIYYMDVGTDIEQDIQVLADLCIENKGMLFFENRAGHPYKQRWINRQWTKRDCFVLMDCDTDYYYNGPQTDAAYQVYQKTPETIKFVTEWFQYCTDRRILTDEPNTQGSNLPEFVEHRWDQSVLSLLILKYKYKLYPAPTECGDGVRPDNCPYQRLFLHHRGIPFGRK
jgi:hypothetical protein